MAFSNRLPFMTIKGWGGCIKDLRNAIQANSSFSHLWGQGPKEWALLCVIITSQNISRLMKNKFSMVKIPEIKLLKGKISRSLILVGYQEQLPEIRLWVWSPTSLNASRVTVGLEHTEREDWRSWLQHNVKHKPKGLEAQLKLPRSMAISGFLTY